MADPAKYYLTKEVLAEMVALFRAGRVVWLDNKWLLQELRDYNTRPAEEMRANG